MSKNPLLRFFRYERIWRSALWSSPIFALSSSAPVGTRIVARALPGGGGSAARARASAACLAAWRAAQGAAPRRPSFRLGRAPASGAATAEVPGLFSFGAALSPGLRTETGAILTTGAADLVPPFAGGGFDGRAPLAIFCLPIPLESLLFLDIVARSRGDVYGCFEPLCQAPYQGWL